MNVDYKIIKRYLDGQGTLEDKKQVDSWFNSIQDERELRDKSYRYWSELPENVDTVNYNESVVLGNIYRKIKIDESIKKSNHSPALKVLNYFSRIAAVLFIPLLIMYCLNSNFHQSASEITYSEIYSPPGARTMFYLPDGSKGWLNSGSSIKFPDRFIGKTRNITLRGEGYFDVLTDPDRPFVVSSKDLNIVATGTSFNVCSWNDDPYIKVVLNEGKLEVYQGTDNRKSLAASLKSGQLFNYSLTGSDNYVQNVDVEKYISWTSGKLIFRGDPLTEVVEVLNRWYNVNIIIKDDMLKTYRYVATFEDETLDEILKMLKISAPIDYKIIDRKQLPDGTFEKRTIELYYNLNPNNN